MAANTPPLVDGGQMGAAGAPRRRSVGPLAALCAAASLCCAAAPALAQSTIMSMIVLDERSTFAPELTRGDLEVFARVLGLSDEERRALHDLYAAYAVTLASEGREVRAFCAEIVERAEVVQDQRILAPARKRVEEWKERSEQPKAGSVEDLRVLLTSEQESRWPVLERELRRLKRVSEGRLPGEAVDLIRILGDTPGAGEPSAALAEVLERYSGDLDRAIVARDMFVEEHEDGFSALLSEDRERALGLLERSRRLRTAIRDVNDRYTRLIAAELPSEVAAAFERRVFEAGHRRLAEPTRGERYIRAAGELSSLSSEQAETVRSIVAAYDAARQRLLERTARAEWDYQIERVPETGPREGFRAFGLGEDHPVTALRMERYELDRATRAKIDAVLTPEQRSSLPDSAVGQVYFADSPAWGL